MAQAVDAPIDLEELVRDLRDSDIYAGLETNGLGLLVWISDQVHGRRVVHTFEHATHSDASSQKGAAAHWLHSKALELFPTSPYASRHSGRSCVSANLIYGSFAKDRADTLGSGSRTKS